MAKLLLRQPHLLTLLVAGSVFAQGGCVRSYADAYDCDEDLVGRPVALTEVDETMTLRYPVEDFLSTLESPMRAQLGRDDRLFHSSLELQQGSGESVELTLAFGPDGTFYDGQGALCDTRLVEFPVEVFVRRDGEVVFAGAGELGIVEDTFGKDAVRIRPTQAADLLELAGITSEEAEPVGGQERHAVLDVYAVDGVIRHVRLEVANYSETSGSSTPLVEVLFENN